MLLALDTLYGNVARQTGPHTRVLSFPLRDLARTAAIPVSAHPGLRPRAWPGVPHEPWEFKSTLQICVPILILHQFISAPGTLRMVTILHVIGRFSNKVLN